MSRPVLLVRPGDLEARRAAAAGPLRPLVDSLAADLEPVIARPLWVPPEKARLTRSGGRCPSDGALLEFDPWSPRTHLCPRCGRPATEEAHYRWWIMGYQLWLAERAVHAATLALLRGDPRHEHLAAEILERYADVYLSYPNRDNVLGPSRLFFSTYLESVWMLQVAVAASLLDALGHAALVERVRERILAPAAALVRTFDEGLSNRQTWNDAALLAAARLLDDQSLAARAVEGPSGLVAHLRDGLLADGTWYEGENYHLFAHRALWYGVTMAEAAGCPLGPDRGAALVRRFDEGFVTPFLTALPDLTAPARRDSQYATSLRQWRTAEMVELGLARRPDDARLRSALARLYTGRVASRDTGRARSTAEAERNVPASALTRADLGWKSLWHASPVLPPLVERPATSVLLESQGLAIFRRDAGRLYAALDYGHAGAGHGHADRLALTVVQGAERWLEDMGTGSYTDESLFWYRSTLAHNAPLVDGRSQRRVHGRLVAADERGGAGWVCATAAIADGAPCERALVVMPDYIVDELTWSAGRPVTVDLPVHIDAALSGVGPWCPASPGGAQGLEDGFRALVGAECAPASGAVRLHARRAEETVRAWIDAGPRAEWWRAVAPGPPGSGPRRFHFVRVRGATGRIVSVWSTLDAVADAFRDDGPGGALHVELRDGSRHIHRRTPGGWRVDLAAGHARSSIDLGGLHVAPLPHAAAGAPDAPRATPLELDATGVAVPLGAAHYRRSEESWEDAGAPTATVILRADAGRFVLDVDVRKRDLAFAPPRSANELDNEHPDIHGDGVQLHLHRGAAGGADPADVFTWLLVPDPARGDRAVRVTQTAGTPAPLPAAEWQRTPAGYRLACTLLLADVGVEPGRDFGVDVAVNESSPERERRRGQLVLSGARGEFVYLRGDRQPPSRSLRVVARA